MNKAEYNLKWYHKHRESILARMRSRYSLMDKHKRQEGCRKYYKENKEAIKEYKLKYRYNISLDEFNRILLSQNNRCAICGFNFQGKNKDIHIDHNHIID
jgi:hypothetical protein